uniref:Uncharacterized protein n=1 Tax=Naja naja TaxID=35670 RepID=A0A8C6XZY1_NAJNA
MGGILLSPLDPPHSGLRLGHPVATCWRGVLQPPGTCDPLSPPLPPQEAFSHHRNAPTMSPGIGKAVALDLARRNARTILACRCREKGRAVVEEIRRATGNPQVQLSLLDVSSMASVRAFARRFLEEGSQLHILVNNAGVTGNGMIDDSWLWMCPIGEYGL